MAINFDNLTAFANVTVSADLKPGNYTDWVRHER